MELFEIYKEEGVLETDDELVQLFQTYTEERFEFMTGGNDEGRETAIKYITFLHKLGVWYWDTNVMTRLQNHFSKDFTRWHSDQLCELLKLVASNYFKPEELLVLLEDCMKTRVGYETKNGRPLQSK